MMEITIKVPDMTCQHCKMNISRALKTVSGLKSFDINLDSKLINLKGDFSLNEVRIKIEDLGYTVITN